MAHSNGHVNTESLQYGENMTGRARRVSKAAAKKNGRQTLTSARDLRAVTLHLHGGERNRR